MSDPMPFRSMSVSESEVRRALVSMTAERDALADKYQTAISCLADERRKKQAAIGDRDEWEQRFSEQTKLASEVIAQRDLANERVEAKQSAYERCADQLTAMTSERDAALAEVVQEHALYNESQAQIDALKAALTDADDALNMIDGDTQETFIQKQALAARSRIAAALGKEQP